GIKEGKWVQNIFTVAKTLALIALIVVGLTVAVSPEAVEQNFAQPWNGITATAQFQKVNQFMPWAPAAILMVLCGAMVGSLFSADAWHNVTFTAGEVRNPKRNLPRSLVLGTGLVILLYLLANCAYLAALPLKSDPPADPPVFKGLSQLPNEKGLSVPESFTLADNVIRMHEIKARGSLKASKQIAEARSSLTFSR